MDQKTASPAADTPRGLRAGARSEVFGVPTDCDHWLEIQLGRTAHPRRPILCDRTLIGSAGHCQIQIAADVAPVHAMISRIESENGVRFEIEALAPEPGVLVNGTPVRRSTIVCGDLVGIAGVNFSLCERASRIDRPHEEPPRPAAFDLDTASVEAMSAGELVAAMERDLELLAEKAVRERRGLGELMRAVAGVSGDPIADVVAGVERQAEATDVATLRLSDEQRVAQQLSRVIDPLTKTEDGDSRRAA